MSAPAKQPGNGEVVPMSRAAEEALRFIKAGFVVVPVRSRSKAALPNWETSAGIPPEDVPRVLRGEQNYGVKMMDGATDVDLDCPEAIALAPKFLLKTGAVFGRASKRASHYVYWTDLYKSEDVAVIKCEDVDGKALVELRMGGGGNAAQVVGPGSVHESGEVVEWSEGCGPEQAERAASAEVKQRFHELSGATLLARHWTRGGRNDATLSLAGGLARLGWDEDKATEFVAVVAEAAADDEVRSRLDAVRRTFRKAKTDKKTTGWPTLRKLLGKELVGKVLRHLAPEAQDARERLEEMNERYCVVRDGGKTRVLEFEQQNGPDGRKRKVATFYAFDDFRNFYCNEFVFADDKPVPLGQWWLRHRDRRTYEGLTFRPDLEPGCRTDDGCLNLWQGWGVTPKHGDWSLMRAHIREVLAVGDEEVDAYIINWLAWTVQHPERQAEAVLVLKGGRGTGKGTLGEAMRTIFGQHAIHISSAIQLAGRFNAHLRDCCFLFADEAFWPGDKAAEGNLKRLVTERTLAVEAKFKDVVTTTNMLHILMGTNEDWAVPAGEHERRFVVLAVAEHKRQDQNWFGPLYEQLYNGGHEAMLYDLLHHDLGDWHPREVLRTAALQDQQRHSLSPLDAWVVALLEDGMLPGKPGKYNEADPNPRVAVSHADFGRGLLDQASRDRGGSGLRYKGDNVLTGYLRKALGCEDWRDDQQRGWEFPPLAGCRAKWDERFPGWPWPHPDQDDWADRSPPEANNTHDQSRQGGPNNY